MRTLRIISAVVVVAALGLTACSSDGDDGSAGTTAPAGSDEETADRPDGPAAAVTGPLEGGNGLFLGTGRPGPDLEESGYTEDEYRAAGTATSYTSAGEL